MLLECDRLLKPEADAGTFRDVLDALSRSTRDTDITGWHKKGSTVGVIFTELDPSIDGKSIATALLTRVVKALTSTLSIKQINQISVSFYVFPQDWDGNGPSGGIEASLYDHLLYDTAPKRISLGVKRLIDIVGSIVALVLGLPLFIAIAAAIKLTSQGPIFFRQVRLGQYGNRFTLLKFRSMCVNNDDTIHREYMKQFITGANGCARAAGNQACYKLTADPRVTPVGKFLRKSSLDELPQFLNVLRGEMSLVGPRPAVPYEAACYDTWHRVRVLAVKPGITGLWQVVGRSRVKFDDMVRLDLRYAQSWSLWLDLKILLQTPQAVLSANGAQ